MAKGNNVNFDNDDGNDNPCLLMQQPTMTKMVRTTPARKMMSRTMMARTMAIG